MSGQGGERCRAHVGSKPSWMGSDQYDPCRCLLPKGHDGEHHCSHTLPTPPEPLGGTQ